jgi:hypothetical protein
MHIRHLKVSVHHLLKNITNEVFIISGIIVNFETNDSDIKIIK